MGSSSTEEFAGVVEPARKCVRVEQAPAFLELRRRGFNLGTSIFLCLWLIGWTVGCVWLASEAIQRPGLSTFVFCIPFWASWFLVAGIIVNSWFGFEGIRIDRGSVSAWRGIGTWRFRAKSVPLNEVREASEKRASYEINDQPVYGVQIRTVGLPLIFGNGLDADERAWLVATINQRLTELGARISDANQPADRPDDDVAIRESISDSHPVDRSVRPSDSQWELTRWPRGLELVLRGKFNLILFGVVTFFCLFWNGIVSVFVMSLAGISISPTQKMPQEAEWWGLFFFLIPFVVIGLGIFGFWLVVLALPWARDTVKADRNEIVVSSKCLGIGRTRSTPTSTLLGILVRKSLVDPRKKGVLNKGDGEWEIVFVDRSSRESLRIPSLTEGDAHWIAAQISDSASLNIMDG